MARKRFQLLNQAAFTASIGETPIAIAPGSYVDSVEMSINGTLAAASTVATNVFLGLLAPFQWKVNGNPIISMRALDIFALDVSLLGHGPQIVEGAAATQDKVWGLRLPVWYTVGANDALSYLATRVAQTNVSGELISLTYTREEGKTRPGFYDMVEITGTTPASTGIFTAMGQLPAKGSLVGILFFGNTPLGGTSTTVTLTDVRLYRNDSLDFFATWPDLQADGVDVWDPGALLNASVLPIKVIMANYGYINLADDPWDLTRDRVRLDINAGVASDPFRFIPVYLRTGGVPGAAGPAPGAPR